ncbi:MAG: protein kinase domain-containing protein [Chthoniobacterales bacterium]
MPNERAERLAELVKSALELPAPGWPAFLDQECRNDRELRAEIESLLIQQDQIGRFLEEPAVHLAADELLPASARPPGEVIGDYEILSLIARGGMGEVYLAEDCQLGRQVALKLIRRGLDSANLIRHFRREERLLASLNHPNIAQLFGGGVTPDGIPFFAMEYVEGRRLDEHCDALRLPIRERLELFRKICGAVTYAHQRLVIHRDLKPGNIRVTPEGEPKLLDFGIAKLLEPETSSGEEPTLTFAGAMTPEYASPEQVRGEAVATTSDVYSLGVVLFRLLTGQSPYRTRTSRAEEISRAITDQKPDRPSAAVSAGPSAALHSEKSLRGDLDNIVLKALRKEPERRYPSAAELSDDIAAYLKGLPVSARKDTWSYRSGKFVRRHKMAVAATAVFALILLGAMGATVWQARVAIAQGRLAAEQRDRAEHERAKAERINDFLQRMLSFSNQSIDSISPVPQKKDVTVNTMLDEIAPQVEAELPDQPDVRAKILHTIGSAYASQGRYLAAEKNLRAALKTATLVAGEDGAEIASIRADLGLLLMREFKLAEASGVLGEVVSFHRAKANSPEFDRAAFSSALESLGVTKFFQGDSKSAISLLTEALAVANQANLKGIARTRLASIKTDLGGALIQTGELAKGETLLRASLVEYRQILTRPRWEMGATLTMLGVAMQQEAKLNEAEELLLEGEKIYEQTLGDENAYLATNLQEQVIVLFAKKDFEAAEAVQKRTLAIYRALFPENPERWVRSLTTLGGLRVTKGLNAVGEQDWRQALAIYEKQPAKDYGAIAEVKVALSQLFAKTNRFAEAREMATIARDEAAHYLGPQSPAAKAAAANWTKVCQPAGR